MAKRKKFEAINDEFHLPDVIIQRIQSFLCGKQAAQTTMLSKSWYRAWLTRPILDFDGRHFEFCHSPGGVEFLDIVMKAVQRYKEQDLNIDSFRLYLRDYPDGGSYLVSKLILKALKRGVTSLTFRHDFDYCKVVLPHEVLESKNLVRLYLQGCTIDQGADRTVRCSRLRSLKLSEVTIERGMISNVISSCPLLEKLSLSRVQEFKKQGVENLVLDRCKIDRGVDPMLTYSELKSLSLEEMGIESDMVSDIFSRCPLIEELSLSRIREFVGPMNSLQLLALRHLILNDMEVDGCFFDNLSLKIPSLKDLTLNRCTFYGGRTQISSRSLELLNIAQEGSLWVDFYFDVPSLRKFTFKGSIIPSLYFQSTSRKWESHVTITCLDGLCTSWFIELNTFLMELRRSKVYLSLDIHSKGKSFNYDVRRLQGLSKPQVENFTVDIEDMPSLSCYALFDGLFRICRPKLITQNLHQGRRNNDFLCMELEQAVNEKCSIRNHSMYGLYDLKDVNAKCFDEAAAVWKPLSWNSLLAALERPRNKKKICFQLKWR